VHQQKVRRIKAMSNLTAIDADGHVIEKESEIRKYLKEPWNRRSTALRPGDQPWDKLHVRSLCHRANLEQALSK